MYRDLYSLARAPRRMTAALVKHATAAVRGMRRIPVWQLGLAASAALMLLASLLWLAPWQVRPDAPSIVSLPMPAQDGGRLGGEAEQAAPMTGPHEASGAAAVEPRDISTISEESAEVLDTQAMQELLARLELSRSSPAEHLDTQAMDNLLARLDAGDKTPLPAVPHPRAARRRSDRTLPRATVNHRAHGFASSPQQSDPALVNPAPGFP